MKLQQPLSFSGCRSRAEAERRLRGWLEQLAADSMRQVETTALTQFDADPDVIDNVLEANATEMTANIEQLIKKFRTLLHSNQIGPG